MYLPYTKDQKAVLESTFEVDPFPNKCNVKEAAKKANLSENQVRKWLSRKRSEVRQGRCDQVPSTCEFTKDTSFMHIVDAWLEIRK